VIMMDPDPEYRIPAAACKEMEKVIQEDLKHATVESACVSIMEDRRIVVDEITFRLPTGRLMSVDVGDAVITLPPVGDREGRSKRFPALLLETFVERDENRPWVREGWRESDILLDYCEEWTDALREAERA